jgi:hypothetical protein
MAELKWSFPDRPGSVIVKAGDEVCPPVPPRAVQRGVVAFLEHVPGLGWDERMAQLAGPAPEAPAEEAPVGMASHAGELVKEPRTAKGLGDPQLGEQAEVSEAAGKPGAEGQVPAGPEAPAPALVDEAPKAKPKAKSKSKGKSKTPW